MSSMEQVPRKREFNIFHPNFKYGIQVNELQDIKKGERNFPETWTDSSPITAREKQFAVDLHTLIEAKRQNCLNPEDRIQINGVEVKLFLSHVLRLEVAPEAKRPMHPILIDEITINGEKLADFLSQKTFYPVTENTIPNDYSDNKIQITDDNDKNFLDKLPWKKIFGVGGVLLLSIVGLGAYKYFNSKKTETKKITEDKIKS